MDEVKTLVSNLRNAWAGHDARWSSKVWHGRALEKGYVMPQTQFTCKIIIKNLIN